MTGKLLLTVALEELDGKDRSGDRDAAFNRHGAALAFGECATFGTLVIGSFYGQVSNRRTTTEMDCIPSC